MRVLAAAFAVWVLSWQGAAPSRQVAITIDDLPRGGDGGSLAVKDVTAMTRRLLAPLHRDGIPVIGFVSAGRAGFAPAALRDVLDIWLDHGAALGNHTYSHPDINGTPLEAYAENIARGEPPLRAALGRRGKTLEFFRHPFLHTGPTMEVRRGLEDLLAARGYRVAPVTIDNSDYQFAALYTRPRYRDRVRQEYVPYMESVTAFFEQRAVEVVGREIPQILLIHASELNADAMPDLLAMFRRRGYAFVTLEQALRDPAYRQPDAYAGPGGFSWIHRWSRTKGMPAKGEPDPPAWVQEAWATQR